MFPRYICWVWVHSRRSKSLIWEGTFSESVFEIIKKWRRRGRALNNSSGNLHSTLHCIALTRPKRFRKEINYILIHHNTLQSFVWSSITLNIHFSHFENGSFVVSLHFNCFRNDGEMKVSKVHRTCHSINGGSLEFRHVFHLSIITSYKKNTIKYHFCP